MQIEMRALGNGKAEIDLYGTISRYEWEDTVSAKGFRKDLKALGDVSEINLHIHSNGGDVFEGKAIATALKQHDATVNVYIDGVAASMAGIIAIEAGDKIYMAENGWMMVHEARGSAYGTASEVRRRADLIDSLTTQSIDSYFKRAEDKGVELSRGKLKQMFAEETWLSAEQAVEYGFADEITEQVDIAAMGDSEFLAQYERVPEAIQDLTGAPAPVEPQPPAKGDPMDLKQLKADHAELVAELRNEIVAELKASNDDNSSDVDGAVAAERDRISEIYELAPNAELAQKAVSEGTSVEQFAVQLVRADKQSREEVAAQQSQDLDVIPADKQDDKEDVKQEAPIDMKAAYNNFNSHQES